MDQKQIIDDPVSQRYLHELVGTEGMQVALSPFDGEITDEEIAEQLDIDVKVVRRTLIILNENNLADYRRVRDESSGWLTYYWSFEYQNIPNQLEESMETLLELLREREEYENTNQFYRCEVCRNRESFEDATEFQFTCPQCGSDLQAEDSTILYDLIKKRRQDLEQELQE